MAKKHIPNEAELFLKNLDLNTLTGLTKITRDETQLEAIRKILIMVQNFDKDKILRSAGGIHSMDEMIDNTIDQSFHRGRISLSVLLHAIIINAPTFLDKAMEVQNGQTK